MHIIPNGQNIQFMIAPPKQPKREESLEAMAPPAETKPQDVREMKTLSKDIAPGLNRKQRRMKLAELKMQAKTQAAAAAKAEIARQKKEQSGE